MSEFDEASPLQRDRQRQSKETKKAQKLLKVMDDSIRYEVRGNKIVKTFKKNNGNAHSVFVDFVEKDEKTADGKRTGRRKHSPSYLDLKKKGLLK